MDSESWEVIEDNESIKKEFLDYFYGLVSKLRSKVNICDDN